MKKYIKICRECDKPLETDNPYAHKHEKCKKSFKKKASNPKVKRHSAEFEHMRRLVNARDGFCCLKCGSNMKDNPSLMYTHQIDKEKRDDDPKNLATLCRSCSQKVRFGKLDNNFNIKEFEVVDKTPRKDTRLKKIFFKNTKRSV